MYQPYRMFISDKVVYTFGDDTFIIKTNKKLFILLAKPNNINKKFLVYIIF